MIELAIEIGNSFTTIIKKGYGVVLREPTLVAVGEKEGKYFVSGMGIDAAKLQGKTNEKTTIFSPISGGKILAEEYLILLLKHFLKKIDVQNGKKFTVLFCVSVGFNKELKHVYLNIAKSIGAKECNFLPCVILSALGYNLNFVEENTGFMIVDLGGGKCDLAAVSKGQVVEGLSIFLGGKTIDQTIVQFVEDKFGVSIGTSAATKIKEEIASLYEDDFAKLEVLGRNLTSNKIDKILISSANLFPIIDGFCEKIAFAIENFLALCPDEIALDIASRGIYLSSRLSSIPNLLKYLEKKVKVKFNLPKNFETAICDGVNVLFQNKKLLNDLLKTF